MLETTGNLPYYQTYQASIVEKNEKENNKSSLLGGYLAVGL